MRRHLAFIAALVASSGCVKAHLQTIHVAKVEGCWVRHTEAAPNDFAEEIGPCARREPQWSNDRVARLVQECMAEADYRWESQALSAWGKGLPLPPQENEASVMGACMHDASTTLVMENESLRARLSELSSERDQLRASAQEDVKHHRLAERELARSLGEAAKRPSPNAYAQATSSGTATTSSEQSATAPATPPVAPRLHIAKPASATEKGPGCLPQIPATPTVSPASVPSLVK
jgi:hypothetical protein